MFPTELDAIFIAYYRVYFPHSDCPYLVDGAAA
jgi:hypothetical protein